VLPEPQLLLVTGADNQRDGERQHDGQFPSVNERYTDGRGERNDGGHHLADSHTAGLRYSVKKQKKNNGDDK